MGFNVDIAIGKFCLGWGCFQKAILKRGWEAVQAGASAMQGPGAESLGDLFRHVLEQFQYFVLVSKPS